MLQRCLCKTKTDSREVGNVCCVRQWEPLNYLLLVQNHWGHLYSLTWYLFNPCLATPERLLSKTSLLVWPCVCSCRNVSLFLPVITQHQQSDAEMPKNIKMADSVPLTSQKLKVLFHRAQSQSWGWWMALTSLIVSPSSLEREQISAGAEWCVRPLLPSYGVLRSLMWFSFCMYCRHKERELCGQIARLRRMGRLWGWGIMRQKAKKKAPGMEEG